MRSIAIVVYNQLMNGFRNRWILGLTILFALFAVGIAYAGGAASGHIGYTSLATTITSQASLAAFLIPLIALLLGYDAVVGEREQGTLLLLLSYPVSRGQMLTGKFLGHFLILVIAIAVGFGLAAVLSAWQAGGSESGRIFVTYGIFILSASLLGATFLGLAYIISVRAVERTRAAGVALLIWFFFVVVFDLVLLAVLVGTGGNSVERIIIPYVLLLNPVDVFRLVNLLRFGHGAGAMTLSGAVMHDTLGWLNLLGILFLWGTIPVSLAIWRFRRSDI